MRTHTLPFILNASIAPHDAGHLTEEILMLSKRSARWLKVAAVVAVLVVPSAAYAQAQSGDNTAPSTSSTQSGPSASASSRIVADTPRGEAGTAPLLYGGGNESTFRSVFPCRVMDTRVAVGAFGTGETREFRLHGISDYTSTGGAASCTALPSTPTAIVLNVTVTGWSNSGYLTVYPANVATQPNTSTINWAGTLPGASSAIANGITLVPALTGVNDFKIWASSGTHIVLDLIGYYDESELAMSEVVATQSVTAGNEWDFVAQCPVGASVTGGGYSYFGVGQNVEVWQASTDRSNRNFHTRGKNYSTSEISIKATAECLSGTTPP
jgi:hypothetical protein